jgi:multidrug resistance efflux pump
MSWEEERLERQLELAVAEVDRLQAEVVRLQAEVDAAYKRGAEAMRERAADLADRFFFVSTYGTRLANQIMHTGVPKDSK